MLGSRAAHSRTGVQTDGEEKGTESCKETEREGAEGGDKETGVGVGGEEKVCSSQRSRKGIKNTRSCLEVVCYTMFFLFLMSPLPGGVESLGSREKAGRTERFNRGQPLQHQVRLPADP